jgi:hypothetical protein
VNWRLLAVVGLAACKPASNSDCARAVHHLVAVMEEGGKPSDDERAAIDQVAKASIERCEKEGLSVAQRDCVLATKSLTDRTFLMCPALVAKRRSGTRKCSTSSRRPCARRAATRPS